MDEYLTPRAVARADGTREFRFCDPSPRFCNTKFEIRIKHRIESSINPWSPIQNRHEHRHFAATASRSCPARSAHALGFFVEMRMESRIAAQDTFGLRLEQGKVCEWFAGCRFVSLYGTQAGTNLENFQGHMHVGLKSILAESGLISGSPTQILLY